jgi:hypothetical protein
MEKFGGRNFLGRKLLGRILFEMIFVFVEREHPTENHVKSILCSHSMKNKKEKSKSL